MTQRYAERESGTIQEKILLAIEAAGLDVVHGFAPDALGALDHIHGGGRRATTELLDLLDVGAQAGVLDIGAGIGGPARMLAHQRGYRVTCLEPSTEFCDAARLLNRLTQLENRIEVRQGAAPPLLFPDGSFEAVWMQNVGMFVRDKQEFYREIRRVLRPGGRFVFQEVAAGAGGEPSYPVPWAADASASFLVTPGDLRALIAGAGLVEDVFEDVTAAELSRPASAPAQSPLTLAAFVDDLARKAANSRQALEDGRVRLVRAAFLAPAP